MPLLSGSLILLSLFSIFLFFSARTLRSASAPSRTACPRSSRRTLTHSLARWCRCWRCLRRCTRFRRDERDERQIGRETYREEDRGRQRDRANHKQSSIEITFSHYAFVIEIQIKRNSGRQYTIHFYCFFCCQEERRIVFAHHLYCARLISDSPRAPQSTRACSARATMRAGACFPCDALYA